ncbi:hypothetical protein DKZ29_08085 [Limosilactobacillus reuteri]|uniref:hypothetical protein n=1 Tax=Limosilactobacillus reuteri TaxID=1598 RepID=UPI000D6F4A48|nr:hypothetical protein [Limosilactobacillus reuteri]MCT3188809.1 hypothetical protein [Limosilactobacillus reuteri]MCT3196841.1 hypothetical protein [Limosilactobacillus reuteri]MDC6077140.1 hypothetical protein [Limosilactobacillus reuteri]PWT35113.1 hypothetical protein DKZ24_05250 [Limosilactobacillus reuteri]PWT57612.1 hypothetical protein DKZ29_08085 [Limosilactobacillus reuteri]
MQEIHENSKFFKSGNSFGLRLTKSDKEKMHAQPGDEYEKNISSDGRVVTFKKKEKISKDTQKMIDEIFDEDSDLIDALKDL